MGTRGSKPLVSRLILVIAAVLACTLAAPRVAAAPPRERIVVTFAAGATKADRTAVLAGLDRAAARNDGEVGALSLQVAAPAVAYATPAERARLATDERVMSVDVDIPIHSDAVAVTDPAWSEQDGVRRIRGNDVWSRTTGDADVVIAVVDTGVDPANPDLVGRLVDGYDFVNGDTDPRDDNGHGTAAATIAAAAGNSFGIAGLCWRCRVMPVKVLDSSGRGYLSDAAFGIAWAVEHGADVVNVSLGAASTLPGLDSALAQAQEAGVLVIASAGNDGDSVERWPAADPRVMAVAALDSQDQRASYSTYGSWVDVAAPGCNPAEWLDQSVIGFCGTSSAAPLVSGAAALMSTRNRSDDEIRDALTTTAVAVGSGLGAGRIDALAAYDALPYFIDIAGNVHRANIEAIFAADITAGCTPDRYCPSRNVTRGQIATFLDRALDLPSATVTFVDVPPDHPHAEGIAAVAAAGITTGCDEQRFCPGADLTRGQMASLLQRAFELASGPPRFADVPPTHTHARGIWAIAAEGITTGCAPDLYCPGETVSRAQMASFLARALDL